MQTALPPATGDVFELNPELVNEGLEASRKSPRRRMIFPIHRQQEALVQRMLNFLQPETYVHPHCHPREHASETMFVIQGRLTLFVFDENGQVSATHDLRQGALADIEPGVWHGMICIDPDTVILEIKRGPFDAVADKTFADWAPDESDSATALEYIEVLKSQSSDSTAI